MTLLSQLRYAAKAYEGELRAKKIDIYRLERKDMQKGCAYSLKAKT